MHFIHDYIIPARRLKYLFSLALAVALFRACTVHRVCAIRMTNNAKTTDIALCISQKPLNFKLDQMEWIYLTSALERRTLGVYCYVIAVYRITESNELKN